MHCLFFKERSNVVFWTSEKAASTYVKGLFWKYVDVDTFYPHHVPVVNMRKTALHYNDDLENPIHVAFIRDPYQRLVSGFLERLTRKLDEDEPLNRFKASFDVPDSFTFQELVENFTDLKMGENSHFHPQTSGAFRSDIKFDRIFDVRNIDRSYLDEIFGQSVGEPPYAGNPTPYRHYEGQKPAYQLSVGDLHAMDYRPLYQQFYTPILAEQVLDLFMPDFEWFSSKGFNYRMDF